MPGKLGRTSSQRIAMLRNQASELLWYGRIKTTQAKAKELQPYVEKIITKAINTYDLNEEKDVVKTDSKGKEVTVKVVKDSPKKLAARRAIMAKLRDIQEVKPFGEKKSEFKARTKDIKHPLMEKLFNEIAPKYAQRKEEVGQGGGYTRIYLLGERRGDGAEEAIIELV
ncbi:MAG TPA: 50S ribosomal protein L17 [Candidatus Coproplasma avicola]|uniref:50S ribosomal protein L17 n=1 Tax=Candidatus Coproplasma avicola TaxID=2840744 RepID=A0A9D1JA62_9FIRM|nr:50S ribosomal protein L17 [Candidatus Coproplasma avicola]